LQLPAADAWNVIGTGWMSYRDAIAAALPTPPLWTEGERYPQAADIARRAAPIAAAGGGVAPDQALPVYLRDKVALTIAEQRK
jgi:tRNA threonylcarbamoyladenosine biosynthesis protein TsaB